MGASAPGPRGGDPSLGRGGCRRRAPPRAPIEPALALDGVDEWAEWMADPEDLAVAAPVAVRAGCHRSRTSSDSFAVRPDGASTVDHVAEAVDATVQATASDLDLLLWRRIVPATSGSRATCRRSSDSWEPRTWSDHEQSPASAERRAKGLAVAINRSRPASLGRDRRRGARSERAHVFDRQRRPSRASSSVSSATWLGSSLRSALRPATGPAAASARRDGAVRSGGCRSANESHTLSYSGRKRGGAGVSGSGLGASGRSNSSRPSSSRNVRSRGRSRSTTSRMPVSLDQYATSSTVAGPNAPR